MRSGSGRPRARCGASIRSGTALVLSACALAAAPTAGGSTTTADELWLLGGAGSAGLAAAAEASHWDDPGVLIVLGGPEDAAADPLAKSGRFARVLPLAPGDGARPVPEQVTRAAEGARTLALSGGTFRQWMYTLEPRGRRSRLLESLERERRRGRRLLARGGAAEYLAGAAVVARHDADGVTRNPRKRRETNLLVEGRGIAPSVLLIHAAEGEPDLRSACSRARDVGSWRTLILAGDVAWRIDRRTGGVRVHGPGSAWLLDPRGSRRGRTSWRDLRLSILSDGDGRRDRRAPFHPSGDYPSRDVSVPGALVELRRPLRIEDLDELLARELVERARTSATLAGEHLRMHVQLDQGSTVRAGRSRWRLISARLDVEGLLRSPGLPNGDG